MSFLSPKVPKVQTAARPPALATYAKAQTDAASAGTANVAGLGQTLLTGGAGLVDQNVPTQRKSLLGS